MMNIKGKGWSASARAAEETPAQAEPAGATEEGVADEAIQPAAAEAYGDMPAELGEAYADLLRRAAEEVAAQAEPAAASFSAPVAPPAAGLGQVAVMLRCGHIAAHGLILAAIFWVAFGSTFSWASSSADLGMSAQLSSAFSYLTSYALAAALLGSPAVLMAASLPGRAAGGQRLACAAACIDGVTGLLLAGMALGFQTTAPGLVAAAYLALGAVAVVSVMKA